MLKKNNRAYLVLSFLAGILSLTPFTTTKGLTDANQYATMQIQNGSIHAQVPDEFDFSTTFVPLSGEAYAEAVLRPGNNLEIYKVFDEDDGAGFRSEIQISPLIHTDGVTTIPAESFYFTTISNEAPIDLDPATKPRAGITVTTNCPTWYLDAENLLQGCDLVDFEQYAGPFMFISAPEPLNNGIGAYSLGFAFRIKIDPAMTVGNYTGTITFTTTPI
jgi:hypothetical protein